MLFFVSTFKRYIWQTYFLSFLPSFLLSFLPSFLPIFKLHISVYSLAYFVLFFFFLHLSLQEPSRRASVHGAVRRSWSVSAYYRQDITRRRTTSSSEYISYNKVVYYSVLLDYRTWIIKQKMFVISQ